MSEKNDVLVRVEDLKLHFPISNGLFGRKNVLKAVDGVSFNIKYWN